MHKTPQHAGEPQSNHARGTTAQVEPRSQRTYTPSLAVIAKSAGIYHWTPEGRQLFDFTSGVLVSNLGHNPVRWTQRFFEYLGWPSELPDSGFFSAAPMTAYNAVTPVEVAANERLLAVLQSCRGGDRLNQIVWAASGSEAIHKAIWTCLSRDRSRDMIIATRNGFHGKKGFANSVTGSETDRERDPRVKFISFPTAECCDISCREQPFDVEPYRRELEALKNQYGRKLGTLVTEPYLGGGGSYHPPAAYLQFLQQFCRENDIMFILDEVQANFGRTSRLFAFESYGLEPDFVVLGKGLGNGVPVAAIAGRSDVFALLDFGEASDTWSANPLCCASVLATLDEFATGEVLANAHQSSAVIERGLVELKKWPFVAFVRGEKDGMVWGIETRDYAGRTANEWANDLVLECYRGDGVKGIHLLGPLARRVVRVSPPLVITPAEADAAMKLMMQCCERMMPHFPAPSADNGHRHSNDSGPHVSAARR